MLSRFDRTNVHAAPGGYGLGIEPVTLALIGAGVGAAGQIGGGLLSGMGTQNAQAAQNKAAAQAAAAQSAQSWQNYLSSRGINIQQLVQKYPDIAQEYQSAVQRGDKRDFNTWLYSALAAAPNHPIWDDIASPTPGNGAANVRLPAWALDAQGNPLEPSLLQQLIGIGTGANNPATAPIGNIATLQNAHALLQARPDLAAQLEAAGVGSDGRSPEQWLVDHITQTEAQSGGGTFTDALRQLLTSPAATGPAGSPTAPAGPAGVGNNKTLDPAIQALLPNVTSTIGSIYDGSMLSQTLGALQPIADARTAAANAQLAKINEQRGLSGQLLDTELQGISDILAARNAGAGDIYSATMTGAAGVRDAMNTGAQGVHDANISKLADLLNIRRDAAEKIYGASLEAAGGVRTARTTGAKNIYDADLLGAETYNTAAKQALNRVLAEQTAERARRGFTGGSSGSDITRARLTADYTQRGAGERAQAGVRYQTRLAGAEEGYAGDIGRAGIGRATTVGQASEADAIGKLNAAVELAKQLGLSGTTYATSTGNAGITRATATASAAEQNAIANLSAKAADAKRRLGYLTSDADIAKAQADLANAQDALQAIQNDQNRRIGAGTNVYGLAAADLGLKSQLTDQQYNDIDALLKRLSGFNTTPASGPALTTTVPGSVLNNTQIAGGLLSSIGSMLGSSSSSYGLQDLLKSLSGNRAGVGERMTYDEFLRQNPASSASIGQLYGLESIFNPRPGGGG